MAYQAKRKKVYTEEFQLTESDGTVVHTLNVNLDADSMVRKLSEKHVALVNAMKSVQGISASSAQEDLSHALDILGTAVVDILEAVFGPEDTVTIVDFYDNRYMEMCNEVVPFITQVVVPEVRKIANSNKRAVLEQYSNKRGFSVFSRG